MLGQALYNLMKLPLKLRDHAMCRQPFGQTGTLADFIDGSLPALLSFFYGLQRGIPGNLRSNALLDLIAQERNLGILD